MTPGTILNVGVVWLAVLLVCTNTARAQETNGQQPQFVTVTNWVNPPANYRLLNNHFYDANSSPGWRPVTLPMDISCDFFVDGFYGFDGVIKPRTLLTTARLNATGLHASLTISNFLYNPSDFRKRTQTVGFYPTREIESAGIFPVKTIKFNAFPIMEKTNYDILGKPTSVILVYDCGLPYTNKVPVVQRVKVKAGSGDSGKK